MAHRRHGDDGRTWDSEGGSHEPSYGFPSWIVHRHRLHADRRARRIPPAGEHRIRDQPIPDRHLVVWFGAGLDGAGVVGEFISPSGRVVGSEFVIDGSPAPSDNPGAVVFDGTNYLVVWNDEIGGMGTHEWNVYGQLVTPAGALSGLVIPIATEPGSQRLPYVASDGKHYLVTWSDFSNDANNNLVCEPAEGTCADVYGLYLSKSGTPVGTAFPIAAGADNQGTSPVLFADGSGDITINEIIAAVNNALNGC